MTGPTNEDIEAVARAIWNAHADSPLSETMPGEPTDWREFVDAPVSAQRAARRFARAAVQKIREMDARREFEKLETRSASSTRHSITHDIIRAISADFNPIKLVE